MIPVGGIYTLNGTDAKKVIAQLKPKRYIIPMHYGTAESTRNCCRWTSSLTA